MSVDPEFVLLTDPNAVHQMLLRGTIARPSLAQIEHVYGVSISGMQEKIDRQAREIVRKDTAMQNLVAEHQHSLSASRARLMEQQIAIERMQQLAGLNAS